MNETLVAITRSRARGLRHRAGKALTAVALGSAMLLAACGSTDDVLSNPAALPTLVTAKNCSNVTGPLDTVQGLLLNPLRGAAAALPTVGPTAASATAALASTLDTVDGLSAALTTLARTQSPQQFTARLPAVGDSILCAGASLSESLALLAGQPNVAIPGVVLVQGMLAAVSQRVANGLVGVTPGADLTALTSQLVQLSNQLASLAGSLPAQVDQPFLRQILELNALAYNSLALILADVGALNGDKLAADITALLVGAADQLDTLPLPAQLGVPSNVLTPVIEQLRNASVALDNSLSATLQPTLQAVSSVLGGASITAPATALASFADLLAGGIASNGSAVSNARVGEVTQQLNGTGARSLVTVLLQFFGGLLPT